MEPLKELGVNGEAPGALGGSDAGVGQFVAAAGA